TAWLAGGGGRIDGELHVSMHCRDAAVTREAAKLIQSRSSAKPEIGVVLGSGLGAFADELADSVAIPYAEIPGWPGSTAIGHAGKLILGKLCGSLDVAVMAGRAHLYEGYTVAQVVY